MTDTEKLQLLKTRLAKISETSGVARKLRRQIRNLENKK